jgi:hypothetical protein
MIAGYIWSSFVSLTIIKGLMFVEDKAPCYRFTELISDVSDVFS